MLTAACIWRDTIGRPFSARTRICAALLVANLGDDVIDRAGAATNGQTSHDEEALTLPLLPSRLSELLLPGEVRIFPPHRLSAELADSCCVAQLPIVSQQENGVHTVADWMPLLRLDCLRNEDEGSSATMRATCIGRVKPRCADGLYVPSLCKGPGDGADASSRSTSAYVAPVARYTDAAMTKEERQLAETCREDIEHLRQSCLDIEALLGGCTRNAADPPRTFERSLNAPGILSGLPPGLRLQSLSARTQELLEQLGRVPLTGRSSLPEGSQLNVLSDVDTSHEADLLVASFAAAGWYGTRTRTYAAQCRSTLDRLRVVHTALQRTESQGLAMLALERTFSRAS